MALEIRRGLSLTLIFFWTLFFVRIPKYQSLTSWPVNICPGNRSEVEAATLRLNCSDVKESINVYHCLPLSNLSQLVEFCYDATSGLIEAGNCMVLFRETLHNYPCGHFTDGCPNANYFPKNMYSYPDCLKINTENRCYIANPSCPHIRFLGTTTISTVTPTEKGTTMLTYSATDNKSLHDESTSIPALNGNDNNRVLYLIPVLIGVFLPLPLVVVALVILWNKRSRKEINRKGVSSFSVDPGHISGICKDKERRRENEIEPKYEQTVCEPRDYKSKEDNGDVETNPSQGPKDDKQTEHDKEPKNDKQREDDREPKHDKLTEHEPEQNQAECEIIEMFKEDLENIMKLKSRFGTKDDVVLDVLDFAGQGEYYASHQTYIRKDAIFIIVVDTSKDVNKRTEQQERKENLSIPEVFDKNLYLCDRPGVPFHCWSPKDYFYYWLKTIKFHGGTGERIIFIGTHADQKRKDFNFDHLLDNAMAENLVTEADLKPIITDLGRYDKVTEEALTEIKEKICVIINECKREYRPAKWMKFSMSFDIIKGKFPIIEIEDVLKMNNHFDFGMSDTEIADMLLFFQSSGKFILFNTDRLQDIVILDIPWVINCFKYIIADREHVEEDCRIVDVRDQQMLCYFHETGVLEISLYRKILTQKGIPEQYQDIIGEYQSKLGMMFYIQNYAVNDGLTIDGWYVPSINTQVFKPSIERYLSKESSQILCIKFKDYLPNDFFGRLVVAIVNSGILQQYESPFCKTGVDMCYRKSAEKGNEIYLFTSRKILTVQFIGKHSKETGKDVRKEILNIIQQLFQFFAPSIEYEVGFLCRKDEGYIEDSVDHFVSKSSKYCWGCKVLCDWVDNESFWKVEGNNEHTILTRGEVGPLQNARKASTHGVKRATKNAVEDASSISITDVDPSTTDSAESRLPNQGSEQTSLQQRNLIFQKEKLAKDYEYRKRKLDIKEKELDYMDKKLQLKLRKIKAWEKIADSTAAKKSFSIFNVIVIRK